MHWRVYPALWISSSILLRHPSKVALTGWQFHYPRSVIQQGRDENSGDRPERTEAKSQDINGAAELKIHHIHPMLWSGVVVPIPVRILSRCYALILPSMMVAWWTLLNGKITEIPTALYMTWPVMAPGLVAPCIYLCLTIYSQCGVDHG